MISLAGVDNVAYRCDTEHMEHALGINFEWWQITRNKRGYELVGRVNGQYVRAYQRKGESLSALIDRITEMTVGMPL